MTDWKSEAAKKGWDPNWLGSGGYRYCHEAPMIVYIVRNKKTKMVVGRFAGPNAWWNEQMAEGYRKRRIPYVGDVDEVIKCELREML
jgi:hypothetical protein